MLRMMHYDYISQCCIWLTAMSKLVCVLDGDYIYTVVTTPGPAHVPTTPARSASAKVQHARSFESAITLPAQSKTLPRAMFHTESLFERDVPEGVSNPSCLLFSHPRGIKFSLIR